ncbi:Endoribonuclease Dicer [Hypsibius exemplaris]|uniref:Endoribonuclease Dicer n=1 Tax=Hypsibius exemplaris TaxID=2072580 RepID=A0A1W0XDQ7_HYPEX|nr:Endoribonuclease Dicer [Hypsibius exemplaris]
MVDNHSGRPPVPESDSATPTLPEKFTQRAYQDELVERAKEENIICALGTGTGKTYIAIKLIQELRHQIDGEWDDGAQRTFFVVPSVPLVEQQAKALKEVTRISTDRYHGKLGVDEWSKETWIADFRKTRIIVIIHDVFLQLLTDNIIEPDRINLIVLDECHHANEKHPYRNITRHLHAHSSPRKPRILGLSASVINFKLKGSQTIEDSFNELQRCLNCVVVTSWDQSLALHTARPDMQIIQYSLPMETLELTSAKEILQDAANWLEKAKCAQLPLGVPGDYLATSLDRAEELDDQAKESIREIRNVLMQIINCLKSLGPYCAYVAGTELLKDLRFMLNQGIFPARSVPVQVATSALEIFNRNLELNFHVNDIESGHVHQLCELITPRVSSLLDTLKQCWDSAPAKTTDEDTKAFCGIIFVKERINAWALYKLLTLIASCPDGPYAFLKCGFCVGQLTESGSPDSAGDKPSISWKQLKSTLENFREGRSNILVATEVVEEGFDVGQCNLIVRFDLPSGFRSYIQSKGRARMMASKFIIMVERSEYGKFVDGDLAQYQKLEADMQRLCDSRKAPTEAERDEHFADEEYPPFCPAGTTLRITVNTSLNILQRYCNTLPNDNMTTCTTYFRVKKLGQESFVCTAYLPLSAAIKQPVTGETVKRDKLAKKVVALKCCELLYGMNELDDNMLPKSEDSWHKDVTDFIGNHERERVEDKEAPQPGTRRRLQTYSKLVPEFCTSSRDPSTTHYFYAIRLVLKGHLSADRDDRFEYDQSVSVGFLSRASLPALPTWPIYIQLREFTVYTDFVETVTLTAGQLHAVKKFHYTVFNEVIGFATVVEGLSSLEENISDTLFTVPTKLVGKTYSLDWDALTRLITPNGFLTTLPSEDERRRLGTRPLDYENAVVASDYNGQVERFHVRQVRRELTPHSMVKPFEETTAELVRRKYGVTVQIPDQPLLEVRHCAKQLNFLRPKPKDAESPDRNHITVIAELFRILPLTNALYVKCRLLPTILHRMQSLCNTLQLYDILRCKSSVGSAVGAAEQWKELENDHRFRGLYSSSPRGSPASSVNFEMSPTAENTPPVQRMESEESPDPSTPDSDSDGSLNGFDMVNGVKTPQSLGLFFEKQMNKQFYVQMHSRIRKRKNDSKLLSQSQSPLRPTLEALKKAEWMRAPEGCQSSLTPPPFRLDSEFRTDPRTTPFPEIASLLTAITTAKAGDNFDLERMETMGDSFLKLTTCLYLYGKYPNYHEGRLDHLKAMQISNYNLYRLAREIGLGPFVLNEVLEPLINFTPPGYDALPQTHRSMVSVNDKGLADAMEALIGVVLMECGCGSAMKFMTGLGLKVELSGGVAVGSGRTGKALLRDDPGVAEELRQLISGLDVFEEHIGYKFRQPAYLLQAFTHSSFYQNRITDCYQRLEFIGDAILDFMVTRYLFSGTNRWLSPGELTDLRSALVNNKTFSLLAVQNNFHSHIKYNSPKIFALIRKYVEEARTENPNVIPISNDMLHFGMVEDDKKEKFSGYERAEDPKTLGDIFESVAGAIYLDSGCSLDAVWTVYYNMMKERIEFCLEHCPKNPVRVLYEYEGTNDVVFQPLEKLSNSKVRVTVDVKGKGSFQGIGNNVKAAKCSAAKEALRCLGHPAPTW